MFKCQSRIRSSAASLGKVSLTQVSGGRCRGSPAGVFAVFSDFVLACCYQDQRQQPEFSYHQDAAMSKNSVYMGDSDTATSEFTEKLKSFNFIQHLALTSGLQRISVHTGVWMPIAASETPVSRCQNRLLVFKKKCLEFCGTTTLKTSNL